MSNYSDAKDVYSQPPPPFGHALRPYFAFEPNFTNLNSGSYGSTPKTVLAAAFELMNQIEANPDRFHLLNYKPLLKEVRAKVAKLIGAQRDECVLVSNATLGINTILRNFDWKDGDLIIVCTTSYAAVRSTAQCISATPPHPKRVVFDLFFPLTHAEILTQFSSYLRSPSLQVSPKNRRVAIIDSIVSTPGVLMPWKEMVKICRNEGVWSLIDAAHSIGQETGLNLSSVQPDFWVSSCHKWLHVKRPCAILYVPYRNQDIIKTSFPTSSSYHPANSHTKGQVNFTEQFDWNETIDYTPFLIVGDALTFRTWLGGEEKINKYCHELALKGGRRLAEVMGTRLLDESGELTANMTNVELPFPAHIPWSHEIDQKFKQKMLVEHKMYSAHYHHNGRWWTRCSAQVYNEIDDFENIGIAWMKVCKEVAWELNLGIFPTVHTQ